MALLVTSSLLRRCSSLASPACRLSLTPAASLSSSILHHTSKTSGYASPATFSRRGYATTPIAGKATPPVTESTSASSSSIKYSLKSGACSIPHPSKVKKGGEDAHFTSSDHKVIGVADGVGGWSEVGVDPALYSKALMEGSRKFCEATIQKEGKYTHDPRAIMTAGWEHAASIRGSSTCCICVLDGLKLRAANLGDSGFTIIRDGKVAFSSEPQQHGFNFPFQLGSDSSDHPKKSVAYEQNVKVGDVIVAGTDGVFDNISPETIAELVDTKMTAEEIAHRIGKHARIAAEKPTGRTPFAIAAVQAGHMFQGGKLDDITVVVGIVSE